MAGAHQTYLPLKKLPGFGPLFFQKGPFFIVFIFVSKGPIPGPKKWGVCTPYFLKVGGASTLHPPSATPLPESPLI